MQAEAYLNFELFDIVGATLTDIIVKIWIFNFAFVLLCSLILYDLDGPLLFFLRFSFYFL